MPVRTLCAALAAALLLGAAGSPVALAAPPVQTKTQLEKQKLQEEIRQLQQENSEKKGFAGFFATYFGSIPALAGVLTALVAVGGLVWTIRQQTIEQARQKEQDRLQREKDSEQQARQKEQDLQQQEKDREQQARQKEQDLQQQAKDRDQRELESRRLLDDRFAKILGDLGAESEAIQAGAAVSLLTFLTPENAQYHRQTRLAALVNLKVDHPAPIAEILVEVLAAAMRTGQALDAFDRDLSRAKLARIDLSGVDLSEADLAYADLRNANLSDTNLRRARGIGVNLERARLSGKANLEAARLQQAECTGASFHDARLVSIHLEGAVLARAGFQGASLQAAHLEGADLRGAKFQQAQLKDTYFYDRKTGQTAILDEAALRTITRAYDWQSAHFSPEHWAQLQTLAAPTK